MNATTTLKRIGGGVLSIAILEGIGFLSSLLSGDIRGKYEAMTQPFLSPPGGLFGIMWAILYALLGIAIYLVILKRDVPGSRIAITLFCVQLVLNFFWSPIFFAWGNLWIALGVIVIMDILTVFIISRFKDISRLAAILMVPYLLWILFATYLNVGFAVLN